MSRRRLISAAACCLLALALSVAASTAATAQTATLPSTFGPQLAPYKPTTPIAIIGGTLIDATGAAPKKGYTVLMEGDRITQVGPSAMVQIPENAERFDATGMTVMPGIINSNQHIQLNGLYPAPAADLPMKELRARWEENFSNMPKKAFVYLMQGITTMRQTSGPYKRLIPIKHQIDAGEIPGPRIMLGGALIMSPQHFKSYVEKNKTPADALDWLHDDFAYFVVDDLEKDTDKLLGSDFAYWKLYLTDEISGGSADGSKDFSDAEINRIIEKAHAAGKKVDVHANATPEGFKRLLNFKIDTLEHPFETNFLLDPATIAGFAKNNVIVATLLHVRVTSTEHAADPDRFDETDYIMSMNPSEYRTLMRYRDKMLFNKRNPDHKGLSIYDKRASESSMFGQSGPSFNEQLKGQAIAKENMRRFIKAGVKFSMGTDSTSFMNFQQDDPNAAEMGYMVEMGMAPMNAIIASTRNGAEALGMLKDLGTIEAGKLADVIVVAGDPLKSMTAMKRVAVVIKGGVRYK